MEPQQTPKKASAKASEALLVFVGVILGIAQVVASYVELAKDYSMWSGGSFNFIGIFLGFLIVLVMLERALIHSKYPYLFRGILAGTITAVVVPLLLFGACLLIFSNSKL